MNRGDQPIIARMKRLGIEPGKSFDIRSVDPAIQKGLESAPEAARELMAWKLLTLARDTTTEADVRHHVVTAAYLQRFVGVRGLVRRLVSRIQAFVTGNPGYGSRKKKYPSGATRMMLSLKSNIPPMPGTVVPESLRLARRLRTDSTRSATMPTIAIGAAIKAATPGVMCAGK